LENHIPIINEKKTSFGLGFIIDWWLVGLGEGCQERHNARMLKNADSEEPEFKMSGRRYLLFRTGNTTTHTTRLITVYI
jgi:hypothetical protein